MLRVQRAMTADLTGRTGTLADALRGADVYIGVSGGTVPEEIVATMADDAIIGYAPSRIYALVDPRGETPGGFCLGTGMPGSMLTGAYNMGLRVMQSPGLVVISIEMVHETRKIMQDANIGVSPTSVFFSDTVLDTVNWA